MAMTVELSMIVKNEAATLARCLASVRSVVDRIVIGDTGSTDETARIAQSFGAEVISIPWTSDFAAARNAVLHHSQCDWILVLDADEMLDPAGAAALPRLIRSPGPAAYNVWRWNYVLQTSTRSGEHGALQNPRTLPEARHFPAFVRSLNTRLFRRDPRVYFERPVHETVIFRLQQLQLPVGNAPFLIHHLGQAEDSAATRSEKNELYQQIGLEHLQQNPDDARTCFELGLGELEHRKNPDAALVLFLKAWKLDHTDPTALIFAGVCLIRTQKFAEALDLLSHAKSLAPHSIVLHEAMGDAWFHLAQHSQALTAYSTAIQLGSVSALVLAKRGVCEIHTGKREAGIQHLHEALEREPDFPELLDLVVLGAALAQDNGFAASTARKRLFMNGATAFHYSLASTLFCLSGDPLGSQEVAREGLERFPNDPAWLLQGASA